MQENKRSQDWAGGFPLLLISHTHDDIFLTQKKKDDVCGYTYINFKENFLCSTASFPLGCSEKAKQILPLTTDYKQKAQPWSDTYNFLRQENLFPLPRLQLMLDVGPYHGKQLWDVTLDWPQCLTPTMFILESEGIKVIKQAPHCPWPAF